LDCVEALRLYKPDVFAKGGDSWDEKNLPEYNVCKELGIKIVFGVGGFDKLNSSSKLIAGAKK
jgi:bifunctional ADP-heptose synthase (sugar kinase/adenylyltransferase)